MDSSPPERQGPSLAAAFLILAIEAGVVGCSAPPPPKTPAECAPPPDSDVPVIALSKEDTCPRARDAKDGRWDVTPVFPAHGGETLPPSMARLCSYSWVGCGPPDASVLPKDQLVLAAEDPFVVAPLAPASKGQTEVVKAARSRLVRAADALVPLPAASGAAPVLIGIPDTSPAPPKTPGDIALDVVSHGFDVAWVTRFLACPGGPLRPCVGRVRTDLALGRPGGRGARADLAASIVRLVRAWRSEAARGPLVIPIASGWEPAAEGALPWLVGAPDYEVPAGDLPEPPTVVGSSGRASPGARAVWGAIHFAACHGALVIAAAGNDPGYREPPAGAMLPAAWEAVPAPSAQACKGLFGEQATSRLAPPKTAHAPLVHAVGGVDERDHPIFGTRVKSSPRLVAPASLVAAYPDDPVDAGYSRLCAPRVDVTGAFVCERTSARTGTSMAAAVAGGVAAVVWAHRPDLSAHDVMAALYTGGVPLGEKADVSLSGPGRDTIARVSLCGALAAACKGAPRGVCPERLACARPPAFAGGRRPAPFVQARPGVLPLVLDRSGAPIDGALVCPTCLFHVGQVQSDGCELTGLVPAGLFEAARVARVQQPALDVYDALGRRLGYVEEAGFRPQSWPAAELKDQSVFADAASCGSAARVVLRWTACADAACTHPTPMAAEIPMVP